MHPREKAIFQYIQTYKAENDGLSPTHREIGDATGIKSTSLVNRYLGHLADEGLIRLRRDGNSRGIIVVGGSWSMGRTA
jgi:SOS-response transcriptional repressor LexA